MTRYIYADCGLETDKGLLDLTAWPPWLRVVCPVCLGRLIRREVPERGS